MYVTSLHIENLRCFAMTELELQYTGRATERALNLPNANLLLGNNGSGKTTILRGLALAALSPVLMSSGVTPYRLVRRVANQPVSPNSTAKTEAKVILHPQDLEGAAAKKAKATPPVYQVAMHVVQQGDYEMLQSVADADFPGQRMYDDKSPAFLVVGYGATRRVEESKNLDLSARRKVRTLRYERVAGLFESYVSLIPLTAWLPQFKSQNPGRYKQVVNLLNQLLPETSRFLAELEDGDYLFEVNGTAAPFSALSDGYQAYIGWIADLLYHISMSAPSGAKLVDAHGIVLVDEIDLHLHPEWQRSVVPTIAQALPNLQFVFTTHSPIVAGSVQKENIFVMETTTGGASVVRQYDENIYGLNADQILLSPYFNLDSTRAVTFQSQLKSLSVKAGKGDLDAALAYMEQLANPSQAAAAPAALANPPAKAKTAKATKRKATAKTAKKPTARKPVRRK